MASATVPGSEIAQAIMTSPLIMGAIIAAAIILLLRTRRRGPRIPFLDDSPGARRVKRIMLVLIVALLVLVAVAPVLLTVDPRLTYGVWVENGILEARFYQDDTIRVSVCSVRSVELLPVQQALDMLEYRVNGLSDPSTGVHMGYYRVSNGGTGYVLILADRVDRVLVVELDSGDYLLVGVPGIGEVYRELSSARC